MTEYTIWIHVLEHASSILEGCCMRNGESERESESDENERERGSVGRDGRESMETMSESP